MPNTISMTSHKKQHNVIILTYNFSKRLTL